MSEFETYDVGDGRTATMVYITDDFEVVEPAKATLAKIVFSDGEMAFFHVGPLEPETLGGKGSGRYPKGSGLGNLIKSTGITTDPDNTGFILPDGSRIKKRYITNHSEVASIAFPELQRSDALNRLMKELSVIRYIPRVGIELQSVPTDAQAQVIADDFKYGKGSGMTVDVTTSEPAAPGLGSRVPYRVIFSHYFDKDRITADAIRNFAKFHLSYAGQERAAESARLLGGPGSGRYPKGSGGVLQKVEWHPTGPPLPSPPENGYYPRDGEQTDDQDMLKAWGDGDSMEYERMRSAKTLEGKHFLKRLNEAIPDYHGIVYRGTSMQPDDFERLIRQPDFDVRFNSSSSKVEGVTYDFLQQRGPGDTRVLLEIQLESGKDISSHLDGDWTSQEEVLIQAGTKLHRIGKPILERIDDYDVYRIKMREVR